MKHDHFTWNRKEIYWVSWISETKEQEEEVIQPILSINQAFDF